MARVDNSLSRLLNVSLRVFTLGTRFLFIFFLAKYLDPSSVGYYGLFTATIGYSLYFVGMDFYTYVTREILKAPKDQQGTMLKAQAALSGILYLILTPVALFILEHAGWPTSLIWWFFPILLLEHFNQEMSRLLTALSEQIVASFALFVRQGSWAIAVVVLMTVQPSSRNLGAVMLLWTIAGVAAAGLAVWKVRQLQMGGWHLPIDWNWIKRGLGVSVAFLIATLATRGFQTIDRYWLEVLGGIEIVAAYTLLIGVAGTLLVFLDAGVYSYALPDLIKLNQQREHVAARRKVRQMLLQTVVLSLAFGIISSLMLPLLLSWIDRPAYKDAIGLYPWLLMAMVIQAVGLVPHFGLYARGRDKPIIFSHLASLPSFIIATWALNHHFGVLAIPIALNVAFSVILIWKTVAYFQQDQTAQAC